MQPSRQPESADPYEVRPQEWVYLIGWIVFVVGGTWFIYRGIVRERPVLLVTGAAGIVLGLSEAAVIAIKGLCPWRKVVRVTWAILIFVAIVVYYALDVLGHPLL